MAQKADQRVYIATKSVRHIGVAIGRHWFSLCQFGPIFIPGVNVVLFASSLMSGEPGGHWKLPVCKRCIRQAKIAYSAAADIPAVNVR